MTFVFKAANIGVPETRVFFPHHRQGSLADKPHEHAHDDRRHAALHYSAWTEKECADDYHTQIEFSVAAHNHVGPCEALMNGDFVHAKITAPETPKSVW